LGTDWVGHFIGGVWTETPSAGAGPFNGFPYSANFTSFSPFVVGSGVTILPLELKSFTGKVMPNSNMLQWVTAAEQNVREHVVERSVDGIGDWSAIGRLSARNLTNDQTYSFEDRAPTAKSFYRLRSVDNNGAEQKSNVLLLTRADRQFGVTSVSPNPAVNNAVVQFAMATEGQATIRFTDVAGRIALEQTIDAIEGINVYEAVTHQLPAGAYFVAVHGNGVVSSPVRLVKQ
jgi:hypothetical protein